MNITEDFDHVKMDTKLLRTRTFTFVKGGDNFMYNLLNENGGCQEIIEDIIIQLLKQKYDDLQKSKRGYAYYDCTVNNVPIEIRCINKSKHTISLGHSNSMTRAKYPWQTKANKLFKDGGGYLAINPYQKPDGIWDAYWIRSAYILRNTFTSSGSLNINELCKYNGIYYK